MKDGFSQSRRTLLQRSAFGLAALAGSALVSSGHLHATDIPQVSEDDETAKALKYRHNALESERPSADQFCHNCRYYKGGQSDEWARCDLFPGKVVAGNGWCNVWAKKG